MSIGSGLKLTVCIFNSLNQDDVIRALNEGLGKRDADFSGENGDEYLWEHAKAEGYPNNMEYVAAKIKREIPSGDIRKTIGRYLEEFFADSFYMYHETHDIEKDHALIGIAVAWTTR